MNTNADPAEFFSDPGLLTCWRIAARGRADALRELARNGFPLDRPGAEGVTLLQFALAAGHLAAFTALLAAGADPARCLDGGESAFTDAAALADPAFLDEILWADGDTEAVNAALETPLLVAARHGRLAQAKALLRAGALVDHQDEEGGTPLLRAVEAGHEAVAALLLAHGADPELADYAGRAPGDVMPCLRASVV